MGAFPSLKTNTLNRPHMALCGARTPHLEREFAEAARVLRPGGRLAIADIITERPLTEAVIRDADLWASCIGGAAQQGVYLQALEAAGFTVTRLRVTAYEFISEQASNASATYGVKSNSVVAIRQPTT